MKLLTLWQPWASLLAAGVKRHETRTFGTNYRGLVLVHAAKLEPVSVRSLVMREAPLQLGRGLVTASDRLLAFEKLPRGAVVGLVDLADSKEITATAREAYRARNPDEVARGDWTPGRFAWRMDGAVELEPITWTGAQGMRDAPADLIAKVLAQLEDGRRGNVTLRGRVRDELRAARGPGAPAAQPDLFGSR